MRSAAQQAGQVGGVRPVAHVDEIPQQVLAGPTVQEHVPDVRLPPLQHARVLPTGQQPHLHGIGGRMVHEIGADPLELHRGGRPAVHRLHAGLPEDHLPLGLHLEPEQPHRPAYNAAGGLRPVPQQPPRLPEPFRSSLRSYHRAPERLLGLGPFSNLGGGPPRARTPRLGQALPALTSALGRQSRVETSGAVTAHRAVRTVECVRLAEHHRHAQDFTPNSTAGQAVSDNSSHHQEKHCGLLPLDHRPLSDGVPVRQVYGFCFDGTGRVLLREDAGRYGLPGGKPEHGEDAPAVLARECREESQITIGEPVYLGYQEVTEDGLPPYAQLRLAARITDFLPRDPTLTPTPTPTPAAPTAG